MPSFQIYPDGLMSQHVSKWTVGDMIEWRGPFGKFVYKANQVCLVQHTVCLSVDWSYSYNLIVI